MVIIIVALKQLVLFFVLLAINLERDRSEVMQVTYSTQTRYVPGYSHGVPKEMHFLSRVQSKIHLKRLEEGEGHAESDGQHLQSILKKHWSNRKKASREIMQQARCIRFCCKPV
jgi:hypothetical protein